MRWIFYNDNDPNESAAFQRTVAAIHAWWGNFQRRTEDIIALFQQKQQWDLPGWMEQTLQAVHPKLMWEFGPAVGGDGHRLVITPESRKALRPLTATILRLAPQIRGWEFYAYRLPESVEVAKQSVEARTGGNIDGTFVELSLGEHRLIDLTYLGPRTQSPQTEGEDDQQALHDAFVATETLLGEELLDKWIGGIGVGPLRPEHYAKSRAGIVPLDRLRPTVVALIDSVRDRMPAQPHFQLPVEGQWSSIELQPTQEDDYASRNDLLVAVTANQQFWMAAHSDTAFYSERFSRCGETFAYVKIDDSANLDRSRIDRRGVIEDALNNVLTPQQLGCTIGGGTGLRYSYIDLALTDLFRGVDTVRRVLRECRIHLRAWILFFDVELRGEWVGVYDNTPPPPGSERMDEE